MDTQTLFTELIAKGVIAPEAAEQALSAGREAGKPPEDFLYSLRLADEVRVAEVKSRLLGIPYRKVDVAAIPDEALKMIPFETSQHYRVMPISKDGGMLTVGMLNPDDPQAQEALRFVAKEGRLSVGVYLVAPSALEQVWRRYMPFESEIARAVKAIGAGAGGEAQETISLDEKVDESEDAPVIKIVSAMFRHAVEIKASDVHIEPQRKRLRIRFRIDGAMQEMASLPAALIQPIASRVKVLAKMKLDETRVPQDGRFRTTVQGRDIDFRVASFPTPNGEKVVSRVLDSSSGVKDINSLGLSDYNLRILREAIERPYGMILVTGPTGSGKSTTLNAVLKELNTEDVNIVSLEDPVEYFVEGVNQSQVKPEVGYTFASGLRQILRQDPDIIMVGEIRDGETAGLGVNAALTGHLMLSTLHTNNSVGVVPRLTDLGVPPFLLSSALNLMLAQRLVRRLCEGCKREEAAPKSAEAVIKESIATLPPQVRAEAEKKFRPPYKVFKAGGLKDCKVCKGKGVSGRVGIHEIFRMTRELGDIVNGKFTDSLLWDEARRQGIVTLRQDGIIKALEGLVALEDVLQETAE